MTSDTIQILSAGEAANPLVKMLVWAVVISGMMVGVVALWIYLKQAGKANPTADINVDRIRQEMEFEARRVLHERNVKSGDQSEIELSEAPESAEEGNTLSERVKQSLEQAKTKWGK
jgi:hypothetical protein